MSFAAFGTPHFAQDDNALKHEWKIAGLHTLRTSIPNF